MKHWILGLEEEGPDAALAAWLEAQPDPEEAVKVALRAYAFGQQGDMERAPADHPLLRQALAVLRAAVADVEAAAGLPAKAVAHLMEPGAQIAAAAEPQPALSDELVDDKIGKLLDFDQERENADLPIREDA